MRQPQLILSAAAAVLLLAGGARATTILPADFSEMVGQSQVIVHGRVVSVESQLMDRAIPPSRRTAAIETLVTVAVMGAVKGVAGPTVLFRVPGGQVGRYRTIMAGSPEFVRGDEVFLFLRGRPPSMPMPFGLSQGVYRVSRGSGRPVVTPLVPAGAGRVVRGDPARRPLALDVFARQVRAQMERP